MVKCKSSKVIFAHVFIFKIHLIALTPFNFKIFLKDSGICLEVDVTKKERQKNNEIFHPLVHYLGGHKRCS